MWPILASLSLGDATITVAAYSTFLVLAGLAALALATRGAVHLGVPGRAAVAGYTLAILAGFVGARLLDVALDWGPYVHAPGRIVALEFRGFALYGGLVAGLLVAAVLARRWHVSPWSLADSAVPAVAAGIGQVDEEGLREERLRLSRLSQGAARPYRRTHDRALHRQDY